MTETSTSAREAPLHQGFDHHRMPEGPEVSECVGAVAGLTTLPAEWN